MGSIYPPARGADLNDRSSLSKSNAPISCQLRDGKPLLTAPYNWRCVYIPTFRMHINSSSNHNECALPGDANPANSKEQISRRFPGDILQNSSRFFYGYSACC